jgi:hypothetical protein
MEWRWTRNSAPALVLLLLFITGTGITVGAVKTTWWIM